VLTRQGWLVAIGAVALIATGRLLGVLELFVLGSAAAALVIGCVIFVSISRLDLEVGRDLHPARVHAGSPSRVELRILNMRAASTPVLRLRDPVSGTRGADLLLPPLGRREAATAAYRLPTERRGIIAIGPLEVIVSDPFGLTSVATPAAPRAELTVYPRVDEVDPVPYTTGHDRISGIRQPNALGRVGEDFYALRPYIVGDDLRRIHWPSSARHDDLLVRQNELPWQGRTTVLLDVRRSAHRGESIEVAVSAAASIITAGWKRGDLVRLITTDGKDSDFGPGYDHVQAIMEHLAVLELTSGASLRAVLERLGRTPAGGAIVAIVADVPVEELPAIGRLRTRFGSTTIVQLDPSSYDPGPARRAPTGWC
jgi:uncharacterized protein (DUF58 family)